MEGARRHFLLVYAAARTWTHIGATVVDAAVVGDGPFQFDMVRAGSRRLRVPARVGAAVVDVAVVGHGPFQLGMVRAGSRRSVYRGRAFGLVVMAMFSFLVSIR